MDGGQRQHMERGTEANIRGEKLLKRARRGWMWNQFFLQEEYTGSDYQYIGKKEGGVEGKSGEQRQRRESSFCNVEKIEREDVVKLRVKKRRTGTSVIQVTATDADDSMYGSSARLVYSISHGHPYFSVDPTTGVIRTALGPGDMDREQREHYQVVIEAKDMAGQRGGLSGTTAVNITLTDVNDNPPRFTQ
ncbi:hypothetical protein KUCAC02_018187, partial [Chaenocephalus aceratus]